MEKHSLQKHFAPKSICYGCGPANTHGFQLESFVNGERVMAHWQPQSYHHAFPNVLNGGVIGTLLDCHCNWTAAWFLMQKQQLSEPPCTVTAEYTIHLKRPTPMQPLTLVAWPDKIIKQRAFIQGELIADGKTCATCQGLFVAVDENHPAFHRW